MSWQQGWAGAVDEVMQHPGLYPAPLPLGSPERPAAGTQGPTSSGWAWEGQGGGGNTRGLSAIHLRSEVKMKQNQGR